MESCTAKLKDVLRQAGCRFERQGKGDHEIWFSPITKIHFPVDSKIKSRSQLTRFSNRLVYRNNSEHNCLFMEKWNEHFDR